ncbi:MAG: glycosyltransferase [Desulfatiglandaceae bacterium]
MKKSFFPSKNRHFGSGFNLSHAKKGRLRPSEDNVIRVMHMITDLDTGGAEMMLFKLLSTLDRDQFLCRVVSLGPPGVLGVKIKRLGIEVDTLDLNPRLPNPLALFRGIRMLRKWRPHIVQTWMYHADLFGTVACSMAKRGWLLWNIRCANMDLACYPKSTRCVLWACKILSRCPETIVTNSHSAMMHHLRIGYKRGNFRVIPNGFDLEALKPDPAARTAIRNELKVGLDTCCIGFIARMDPMKDPVTFFRAVDEVIRKKPQVHFIICGEGMVRENPEVRAFMDESKHMSRLHLLGRREDIPRILAALDGIVLSSSGESFPNVIGEAMACGVPCVVTDVGDSAKIVGKTGMVVRPKDPFNMAAAMIELIELSDEKKKEMGISARKRIRTHYSLNKVTEAYERLYMDVIKRHSGEDVRWG